MTVDQVQEICVVWNDFNGREKRRYIVFCIADRISAGDSNRVAPDSNREYAYAGECMSGVRSYEPFTCILVQLGNMSRRVIRNVGSVEEN